MSVKLQGLGLHGPTRARIKHPPGIISQKYHQYGIQSGMQSGNTLRALFGTHSFSQNSVWNTIMIEKDEPLVSLIWNLVSSKLDSGPLDS